MSMYSNVTSFFSTWSIRKWCRISICLVLECKTGFLVRLITLVLSNLIGTQLSFKLVKKLFLIHKIWDQQLPAATYSATAVERTTLCCFLLCHEIKQFPNKWHLQLVPFRSDLQPAKSESKNPTNQQELPLGYHNLKLVVPLKYLKINFTIFKYDSLWEAWYLALMQTLNIMSGLLVVK